MSATPDVKQLRSHYERMRRYSDAVFIKDVLALLDLVDALSLERNNLLTQVNSTDSRDADQVIRFRTAWKQSKGSDYASRLERYGLVASVKGVPVLKEEHLRLVDEEGR